MPTKLDQKPINLYAGSSTGFQSAKFRTKKRSFGDGFSSRDVIPEKADLSFNNKILRDSSPA